MSVCSSLLFSQSASASHLGPSADRILSETLQRQWDSIPAGTNNHYGLSSLIAYPVVVVA